MKAEEQTIEVSPEELQALVDRAEQGKLKEGDAQLIGAIVKLIIGLHSELLEKNTSITRLKKILFGSTSEKTVKVLTDAEGEPKADETTKDEEQTVGGQKEPKKENRKDTGKTAATNTPVLRRYEWIMLS